NGSRAAEGKAVRRCKKDGGPYGPPPAYSKSRACGASGVRTVRLVQVIAVRIRIDRRRFGRRAAFLDRGCGRGLGRGRARVRVGGRRHLARRRGGLGRRRLGGRG